jgi:hypothetical protein
VDIHRVHHHFLLLNGKLIMRTWLNTGVQNGTRRPLHHANLHLGIIRVIVFIDRVILYVFCNFHECILRVSYPQPQLLRMRIYSIILTRVAIPTV